MTIPSSITLDGLVEVPVRESKRAKYPSLKVRKKPPYGVELVLPLGSIDDIEEILPFMFRHLEWILDQQHNVEIPRFFANGMKICIVGRKVILSHEPTLSTKSHINGNTLCIGGKIQYFHKKVVEYLKHQTKERAYDKIAIYARKFGVEHRGIVKVLDMRTRWATCNSFSHNITISWRLILAPPYVFDHVIAHEVVHLRISGHGREFHEALARLDPNTEKSKSWLNLHGRTLFRFEK